jgi:hypothetical protein
MNTVTSPIDVAYYIDADNHKIYPSDLDGRVDELTDVREECEEEGVAMDAAEAAELAALQAFKAEVRREFEVFHEGLTIVREEDFARYARWAAEEYDGISSENVGDFVDWERYADNLRPQWKQLELGGVKVMVSDCA